MALMMTALPARLTVKRSCAAPRASVVRPVASLRVERGAVLAAAAAAPFAFQAAAFASPALTATIAAAEVADEDIKAFAVMLGGSAVIVTAVLSLVIGSDLFIKDFSK